MLVASPAELKRPPLVSAGVQPGVDVIFDGVGKSSLLDACASFGTPAIVYSHTASRHEGYKAHCLASGAVAVLCDPAELRRQLALGVAPGKLRHGADVPLPTNKRRKSEGGGAASPLERVSSVQSSMEGDTCSPRHLGGWPTYETWEAYPPVARWLQHASTTSPDAEKGSRGVLLGPKASRFSILTRRLIRSLPHCRRTQPTWWQCSSSWGQGRSEVYWWKEKKRLVL